MFSVKLQCMFYLVDDKTSSRSAETLVFNNPLIQSGVHSEVKRPSHSFVFLHSTQVELKTICLLDLSPIQFSVDVSLSNHGFTTY